MNGVLTVEQKQQVVARYTAGTSLTALAADYGVSRQAIQGILVRRGVDRRPWGKLTDQQKLEVVAQYEAGETPTALAARFGVAPPSIMGILKRRGVCMRPPKQYTVRDEAFDDLTPEAAYWAGFLFADGTIHCRPGYPPNIAVALSLVDKGHLVKLRSFLHSNHAISTVAAKPGSTGRSRHATSVFDPSGSRIGFSVWAGTRGRLTISWFPHGTSGAGSSMVTDPWGSTAVSRSSGLLVVRVFSSRLSSSLRRTLSRC